eukprot:15437933-Alexandrium_andersonii.AAC.1
MLAHAHGIVSAHSEYALSHVHSFGVPHCRHMPVEHCLHTPKSPDALSRSHSFGMSHCGRPRSACVAAPRTLPTNASGAPDALFERIGGAVPPPVRPLAPERPVGVVREAVAPRGRPRLFDRWDLLPHATKKKPENQAPLAFQAPRIPKCSHRPRVVRIPGAAAALGSAAEGPVF